MLSMFLILELSEEKIYFVDETYNNASHHANAKTGDYHGDMNGPTFYKRVDENLKDKLLPNSVVVMDNASYHSVQVEKKPTISSFKREMQDW
ncbi:unnamed protein product [Arctia plantaginis]|uniref:Uncharacterized protein n=1 Tax=Arctia plantaginis TaxID=874455 RepID=A0A8S0YZ75_ARCPL|nr:unnamed protein product [Arctia plantaginis]